MNSRDQQCAAGAVGDGIHHDQRAAHAIVGIALDRQCGLGLDLHAADFVDRKLVGVGVLQRVDVAPSVDGGDDVIFFQAGFFGG